MSDYRKTSKWRNPWSKHEEAIIRKYYPTEGAAVANRLRFRDERAVRAKAFKMDIPGPRPARGSISALHGERVDEAIAMHAAGKSFAEIARHFGVSEAGATNSILIELCRRSGQTPAERGKSGELTAKGLARIREMIHAGAKNVEVTQALGVSSGCVRYHRRKYEAEMIEQGKKPTPVGGGRRYSGSKISQAERKAVEDLLMTGLGTPTISKSTGVSNTAAKRIKIALVKKLARRGKCLPGCDITGKRIETMASEAWVKPSVKSQVRTLLLETDLSIPAIVDRVGGISKCTAYHIRQEMVRQGLISSRRGKPQPKIEAPTEPEAPLEPEIEESPFERQMRLVREGRGLIERIPISRPIAGTLGGVTGEINI